MASPQGSRRALRRSALSGRLRAVAAAGGPIVLTGCGTSEHAARAIHAMLAASSRPHPISVRDAFEVSLEPPSTGLVVGISHEAGDRRDPRGAHESRERRRGGRPDHRAPRATRPQASASSERRCSSARGATPSPTSRRCSCTRSSRACPSSERTRSSRASSTRAPRGTTTPSRLPVVGGSWSSRPASTR